MTPPRDLADADRQALARVLQVRPAWTAVETAAAALGLARGELLHAGPPLADPTRPCTPVANAAAAAIVFEGWADGPDAARRLIADGRVRLVPAQDRGCVVPLADVLSPSMPVQRVADAAGSGVTAFSPLNAGMRHPQRVGVFDEAVVAQLRWMAGTLAPALARALQDGPVELLPLAQAGLLGGDDLHSRTGAATRELLATLQRRGWEDAQAAPFLAESPSFFLNLWMAACAAMLGAGAGVAGSSLVVGGGGNGQHFGIRGAADPSRWHVSEADPPVAPQGSAGDVGRHLPAIGDSAIVDLLGFGAMAAPADTTPAAGAGPDTVDLPSLRAQLLHAPHPGLPAATAGVGITARRVVALGQSPVVVLGILDSAGVAGRWGGGYFRIRMSPFRSLLECIP